jgi:hypothetical protein
VSGRRGASIAFRVSILSAVKHRKVHRGIVRVTGGPARYTRMNAVAEGATMSDLTGGDPAGRSHPQNRQVLLVAALALLIGMALGAGLTAAVTGRSDAGSSSSAQAPGPSPGQPADVGPSGQVVTIPASCRRALDQSEAASSTAGDAARALTQLDTRRVQELLNQLQQAQQEVDALTKQCRQETRTAN